MDKQNKETISFKMLMVVIVIGIFIGSLAVSRAEDTVVIKRFLGGVLPSESFAQMFSEGLIFVGSCLIMLMLCGFCAVGQAFTLLTLLVRGFTIGAGISITYLTYGAKGVTMTAVLIAPAALMTCAVLMLGARESIRQSNIISKFTFKRDPDPKQADVKLYFLKFAVLVVLLLIALLLQSVLVLLHR